MDNSKMNTCWFCQREYPASQAGTRIFYMFMEKKAERIRGKKVTPYQWRKLTILACRTCVLKEKLSSYSEAGLAGGVILAGAFFLLRNLNPALALMLGLFGAVVVIKILLDTRSWRLTEREKSHPALKRAVKEGWKFGKSPRKFIFF